MANGRLARKLAEEEIDYAQGMWIRLHQMEDKPVKATLRKQKLAIRKTAPSTVNGELMVNGLLVHIDAVEVIGTEQDRKRSKKLMVDRAQGRYRKLNIAIHIIAKVVNIWFYYNKNLFDDI